MPDQIYVGITDGPDGFRILKRNAWVCANAPYLLAIDLIHSVATVVAAMIASEVIRPIRCKRIFYIFACLIEDPLRIFSKAEDMKYKHITRCSLRLLKPLITFSKLIISQK